MLRKFRRRYEIWKDWSRNNTNSKLHKILVLLGLRKSFSFEMYIPFRDFTDTIRTAAKNFKREVISNGFENVRLDVNVEVEQGDDAQ